MADEECRARTELRAVWASGGEPTPQQWRAAFGRLEDAVAWAGKHHPNLVARALFFAVAEIDATKAVARWRSARQRPALAVNSVLGIDGQLRPFQLQVPHGR